ncbi:hypothetical protein [Polyangium mundeleinium]|uniref:SH3 domain-containing protein n=1 Tax=Polyangium mundeleinium TaxID=2995306 RepID=A0ABT5EPD3_9BACT|nr:hypothetical protein [Polyangium mundeleinium]MDC0742782.1 hypothetical protein [Polyangium mundeleinium]
MTLLAAPPLFRTFAVSLAALLLPALGCNNTPTSSTSAPSSASASAAAPAASSQAQAPRTLELPEGVCRISYEGFRGAGLTLRLAPEGPAFAIVGEKHVGGMAGLFGTAGQDRSADVVLLDGPAKSVGIRIKNPDLVLRGFLDAAELVLHPVRARALGGFLVPTRFRVVSASSAGVEVAPRFGKEVEVLGSLPAQRLTCAELSLDAAVLDVDPSVLPSSKKDTYLLLRGGNPIDLAVEPAGPAVARLHPASLSTSVRVVETKGKATRIAWSLDEGTVFGWVASSALEEPPKHHRAQGLQGIDRPPNEEPVASFLCSEDVPLVAEVAGERVTVGHVRKGTRVGMMDRAAPYARIAAPRGPDHGFGAPPPETIAAEGATFRVPASALDGCKTQAERPPSTH